MNNNKKINALIYIDLFIKLDHVLYTTKQYYTLGVE